MERISRQEILEKLQSFSTPDRPIYLVGGAVRDLLLNRPCHDFDFALPGDTLRLARAVADRLNGGLYVLDAERGTTRVVLDLHSSTRMLLDFAALRKDSLEGDLRDRDFTINAMAFDIAAPDQLIDPTGGLADLRAKQIRACEPDSLTNDPARVLRAVRQALSLHFRIDADTIQQMRAASPLLPRISAERVRDELFRILGGGQVVLGIRLLDQVGALSQVLPELESLKNVPQSAPHISDAWEHTLRVVQYLEQLLAPLVGSYREDTVADLTTGSAVLWLGRFRSELETHMDFAFVPDRPLRPLLFLAALYHDIAKPDTRAVTPEGKVRFIHHPEQGAGKAVVRARKLALSVQEIDRLDTIIRHHMRVHFMTNDRLSAGGKSGPSRRTIYRFFKDTREAGVDICLLSLADLRGTYGVTLPQEIWQAELETSRSLLEAYWEQREAVVSPPRLLSGNDLMREFQLAPGRKIGLLLDSIQEAQAAGDISTAQQALEFARQKLDGSITERGPLEEE
jgi:tRNA nucleotidyltransferase/poly(A) polymerase